MKLKPNSRVGAVVLAAGSSTRMGELKQLLPFGDRTVLEQTLENLCAAQVDEIVLVLGCSAETIRQQIADSHIESLKIVVNHDYDQGMATSLQAGLSALDTNIAATLVVLGDQPLIRPNIFDRVIDQYRSCGALIVIPTYRGVRGNPVLLDRSVFKEIMALQGDIGCRAIFSNHVDGIVQTEVADISILLDIDNKNDYERLRCFGRAGQNGSTSSHL